MSKLLERTLWAAHQALTLRGYAWEVQRQGESRLGLWRKKFRVRNPRGPIPRRLVFVPGFGDSPLSWLGVMTLLEPVLRRRFDEIVMIDFPGHNGRLFGDGMFPSIDSLMDTLFDVLDSLKPHTLIGHSLGGFLATHYAAACSSGSRVTGKKQSYSGLDSVVVIDPSGFFENESERREWVEKLERLIREGGSFWRPFVFAREPFWFRFLGWPFFKFISREEVAPFLRSVRVEHEVGPLLPAIRTRMALLWGEKDSLLPSNLAPLWLRGLRATRERALGVVIRGSGHSPQLEAPAVTAAVLGQILTHRRPHGLGRRWYALLDG